MCKLVYFVSKKIQMIGLQWELLFHILIMSQLKCHFPWNQHFSCTAGREEIQAIQLDMNHIQVIPPTIPSPPPVYVLDSRLSYYISTSVYNTHAFCAPTMLVLYPGGRWCLIHICVYIYKSKNVCNFICKSCFVINKI